MSVVIKLQAMSTPDLLILMREVSAEIEARLTAPVEVRESAPADPRAALVLRTPPGADKDFVLMIAGLMRGNHYVNAEQRQRVAQIAQEFGPWVERQGLPTSAGASAWQRAGQAMRARRARER